MPEITETELKKQIERGTFGNLYLLHGEEKYLLKLYANRLIDKACGSSFRDFNLQKMDGGSTSIDEIADAVEALPLLAERKCVAVSDLDVEARNASETAKLYELLENVPESTVLVLYLPSVEIDYKKSAKWKKFLAAVQKLGTTVLFKRKTQADAEKMLCAAAAKRHCELSRADAGKIIEYAGNDLQVLFQELEKLCAYVGEGKEITRREINLLVTKNFETTVFLLSRAILARQYDKAYSILDLLFYQNEEPVSILAVLSTSYLDLYRVRAAVQSGKNSLEPAKYFDYKGKEFRLRNAERDGGRFSMEMLRESLEVLLAADLSLKSARGDRRTVMEKLIAQLLLIAEKEKFAE